MTPRTPLANNAPRAITADTLATWLNMTPAGVRVAAARGKIPAPQTTTIPGANGRPIQAKVWKENDRDALITWALENGRDPWIPPHLHPRFSPTAVKDLQQAVGTSTQVTVIHGPKGTHQSAFFKPITFRLPHTDGRHPTTIHTGLMATAGRTYPHHLVDLPDRLPLDPIIKATNWPTAAVYLLHGGPSGDTCTLIPTLGVGSHTWPFALQFDPLEVARALGAWPVASPALNPSILNPHDLRMGRPYLEHPARADLYATEDLEAVDLLLRIIHDTPAGDPVRTAAEVAVHTRTHWGPYEPACWAPGLDPYLDIVMDVPPTPDDWEDILDALPPLHEVTFTPKMSTLDSLPALKALMRRWPQRENWWELNLSEPIERDFLAQGVDGGEVPLTLVAALTDRGTLIPDVVPLDIQSRTVTSSTGEQIVVASWRGRHVALAPEARLVPDAKPDVFETPASRREVASGPGMVRYEDGEVWPLPLPRGEGAHLAGYIGGTPTSTLRTMIASVTAKPGVTVGLKRPDVSPKQVETWNSISHTRWSCADIEWVAKK